MGLYRNLYRFFLSLSLVFCLWSFFPSLSLGKESHLTKAQKKALLRPIISLYQSYREKSAEGLDNIATGKFKTVLDSMSEYARDNNSQYPTAFQAFLNQLQGMKVVNTFSQKNEAVVTVFWILLPPQHYSSIHKYRKFQERDYLLIKENSSWKIKDTKLVKEFNFYDS